MENYFTGINENEALFYLGYKWGEVPSEIAAQLERAKKDLAKKVRARVVYRIFSRRDDGTIENLGFVPQGKDVQDLLAQCHHVILMGATLGLEVERFSRQMQVKDLGYAVIFDACANSAIENVCDNLCAELACQYGHTTDRFSPGYGDLPFVQQQDFDRVLQLQQSIGVTLTGSGLMVPQKSVTAILGVADSPQPRRFTGCPACVKFRNCEHRKEGRFCAKY